MAGLENWGICSIAMLIAAEGIDLTRNSMRINGYLRSQDVRMREEGYEKEKPSILSHHVVVDGSD